MSFVFSYILCCPLPEDEGRWGEATAGFAPPQQEDGWGDWNYEAPPPPPQGQCNFVDRSEYNELVERVGGVEQALQSVSVNFDYLNTNFTAFMNLWG